MTIADFRQSLIQKNSLFAADEATDLSDLLLCIVLGVEKSRLYLMLDAEMPEQAIRIADDAVQMLSVGIPIQYIFGSCSFYGYAIEIGKGCFIPRSDTEVLVTAALGLIGNEPMMFADICAGSGCISKAIAREKPQTTGYALEYYREAMTFTEKNLVDCENVTLKRFDALDEDDYIALSEQAGLFDLILSNPPYIPTDDIETLDTRVMYEPETALDGGDDGMRFYRAIIKNSIHILKPQGAVIFECGPGQAVIISAMLELEGFGAAVIKDLGGIDRVVVGKKY